MLTYQQSERNPLTFRGNPALIGILMIWIVTSLMMTKTQTKILGACERPRSYVNSLRKNGQRFCGSSKSYLGNETMARCYRSGMALKLAGLRVRQKVPVLNQ